MQVQTPVNGKHPAACLMYIFVFFIITEKVQENDLHEWKEFKESALDHTVLYSKCLLFNLACKTGM